VTRRRGDGKVRAGAAQAGRERPGHLAGRARRFPRGAAFRRDRRSGPRRRPGRPRAEILNCGHPPPLLVRDGEVTAAESAAASLPLGLAALLKEAREVSTIALKPGDRLLFYTDGITEARDRQGTFYPLERSGTLLGLPDLGSALDQLIEDVLRHVGRTLQDDAAILLIGLGQPLPGTRRPSSGTDARRQAC
jgi:hypothetical protein